MLAAAMMVSIIGISALLAVRVQRHAARAAADAVQARLIAESVIDIARFRIAGDPDWRNTYTHDTWTSWENAGRAAYRFKLQDEEDGHLADDSADVVRLLAEAAVGDAVRLCSVVLRAEGNLLADGDFENGADAWFAYPGSESAVPRIRERDEPYSGSFHLEVHNRETPSAGAGQDVTKLLHNDATYHVAAWARTDEPDTLSVKLTTINEAGIEKRIELAWGLVGSGWGLLSGSRQVSWEGQLVRAVFHVEGTNLDPKDFHLDNISLMRGKGAPMIEAGRLRREVKHRRMLGG